LTTARWMGFAIGLGAIAGGCTSDLKLSLDGKLCDADQRCVNGYECDVRVNVCVPRGQAPFDGGGAGGRGGASGNGSGPSGGAEGSGASGGAGGSSASGAGGLGSNAGSGGTGGAVVDPNAPDGGYILPDGGCVSTIVYHDLDHDGVGDSSDSQSACPSVDWVTVGDDCRDDLPLVHPGQLTHFAVGFASPVAGGAGVSFDYDCSNAEEPDATNDTNDPVPTCATLLGLDCQGSGFQPATPARSGAGIEPRCGSNVRTDCVLNQPLGACNQDQTTVGDVIAFRCK
jgi:hypothetical protein